MSGESKRKMSIAKIGNTLRLGCHLSEEHKRKISIANTDKKRSEKTKKEMSETRKREGSYYYGKHLSKEHREKLSKAHIGNLLSEEAKRKKSESQRGNKCYNWQGGITPFNQQIRKTYEYRQWRSDVFTRDDFTCQECGQRGCYLHSHHIKSFSSIMQFYEITTLEEALSCEELWNINNGITLCKRCHWKLHKKVIQNEWNINQNSNEKHNPR